MDDRAIAVLMQANRALLNRALDVFDHALGFEINPGKTQIWDGELPDEAHLLPLDLRHDGTD